MFRKIDKVTRWIFIVAAAVWFAFGSMWLNDQAQRRTVEGIPSAVDCDWWTEFASTLSGLGEDPMTWTIEVGDFMGATWGDTKAAINPDIDCRDVAWVITHEWVHLQQGRVMTPEVASEYFGDRIEIVADCGAYLMGERPVDLNHPILNNECSALDWIEAYVLIHHTPVVQPS